VIEDLATSGIFRGRRLELAQTLIEITHELEDWWPLTVRQAYYRAVAASIIGNNINEYQRVSRVLTTLRREGLVSWDAYEDRSRRTVDKRGVSDMATFVSDQLESFLDPRYYYRCRVQEQDAYVEVSVEKDALASIFEETVWPYCVRLSIVRGQVSASMVQQMAERFKRAEAQGQEPVLLHFGDFDPSGVQIPIAIREALDEHHGVGVAVVSVALRPEQIKRFRLPESIDAAKKTDPNYRRFVAGYGNAKPVELDALHPGDLQDVIRESLHGLLDMGSFAEQMEIEEKERKRLKRMRRDVLAYLRGRYPAVVRSGR
jgi:hypothetical protein